MDKKKIALITIAVIALAGIFVGAVLILGNNDKTAGNGTETNSTTATDETTTTTNSETTTTQETTTTTQKPTSTTSNPEQGKEAGRPMKEVVQDTVTLADGNTAKIIDFYIHPEDEVYDRIDENSVAFNFETYINWAKRIGLSENEIVYFKTTLPDGRKIPNPPETKKNIFIKNGYKDIDTIDKYLKELQK